MDTNEKERQRLIGKQLAMVNIHHMECDRAKRGFINSVSRADITEWFSLTEDYTNEFFNTCDMLAPFQLTGEFAFNYSRCKGNLDSTMLTFSRYSIRKYKEYIIRFIVPECIGEFCRNKSADNYRGYCEWRREDPNRTDLASPEVMENILINYANYFIFLVKIALSDGYDWDVLTNMLEMDITQERFRVLDSSFGSIGREWMDGYEFTYSEPADEINQRKHKSNPAINLLFEKREDQTGEEERAFVK